MSMAWEKCAPDTVSKPPIRGDLFIDQYTPTKSI